MANTYNKPVYEDFMTDDDIAIYEQLISLGRLQLGKELAGNEEYLLHISAMITLKQKKGMMVDVNDDMVKELKRIHAEHHEAGLVFETPKNDWYYSPDNLINQPYIPAEVQEQMDADEKKLHPENEIVEKLKEDWVKLKIAEPVPEETAEL